MIDERSAQHQKGKLGEDFVLNYMKQWHPDSFVEHPYHFKSGAATWDFLFKDENGFVILGEIKTYKLYTEQDSKTEFFIIEESLLRKYIKSYKELRAKPCYASNAFIYFVCAEKQAVYRSSLYKLSHREELHQGFKFQLIKNFSNTVLRQIPIKNLQYVCPLQQDLAQKILDIKISSETNEKWKEMEKKFLTTNDDCLATEFDTDCEDEDYKVAEEFFADVCNETSKNISDDEDNRDDEIKIVNVTPKKLFISLPPIFSKRRPIKEISYYESIAPAHTNYIRGYTVLSLIGYSHTFHNRRKGFFYNLQKNLNVTVFNAQTPDCVGKTFHPVIKCDDVLTVIDGAIEYYRTTHKSKNKERLQIAQDGRTFWLETVLPALGAVSSCLSSKTPANFNTTSKPYNENELILDENSDDYIKLLKHAAELNQNFGLAEKSCTYAIKKFKEKKGLSADTPVFVVRKVSLEKILIETINQANQSDSD